MGDRQRHRLRQRPHPLHQLEEVLAVELLDHQVEVLGVVAEVVEDLDAVAAGNVFYQAGRLSGVQWLASPSCGD